MDERETIIFGIPIPSDNKLFLTIVAIHILFGIICAIAGIVAMVSTKGGRFHSLAGMVYYWILLLLFITVVSLSIMRWPHNNHLLVLGVISFLTAYAGRKLARTRKPGWTRRHTVLMGSSYILLLTAFYVDNGQNLPFWNQFSPLFFWLFPALIGIPIIVYALRRQALNKRQTI